MRRTGQIFWLLAYVPILVGITFFPPSPSKIFEDWPNWEVVSSYSSATAPDSHGISCADPLFQARKELEREIATQAVLCKIYLSLDYKPPAQRNNRAVCRECFLLIGESLKDHIAFLTWSDRPGDVPKIMRGVLFKNATEHFLKLRADLSSRVQVMLMILSPRIQCFCL